ncbi:MAG: hypothetical protein MRZ79_23490 [Bacteroidia bacterium]|nr:hypothetical protein [Bacteroidia bacterium]
MKKLSPNYLNKPYNLLATLAVLSTVILFNGCESSDAGKTSEIVATFGDKELRVDQINHFLPAYNSLEDSAKYAQQVVRRWLKQQVIQEAALKAVPDLEAQVAPQLENYKSTLLEQHFAKWLVDSHPEKFEVSESDIKNYYNKFSEKFISEANFYQFFYIKTTKAAQYWIINSLKEGDAAEIQRLIEWCNKDAETYKMDSTYRKEGELLDLSQGYYFGNIRRASINYVYPYQQQEGDVISYCFFKMLDVVKEGEVLPLIMVRDEIEVIIQNQRKQALIDATISRLVEEARATNRFQQVVE